MLSLPFERVLPSSLYDGQTAGEAAHLCSGRIKISMAKRATHIPASPIPDKLTLPALRAAAAGCKACDLWKLGTQTVFGEGKAAARVMMVGEQPGDKEDLQGRPFVGPAGAVLDKALAAAGINRNDVYVTNIVKHFKWEPRGKRRLHKKPNTLEISACRPWLEAEIKVVKPEVVVLLGATAAQGVMGSQFRVTKQRGQWVQSDIAPLVMATVHPSSILRAPDDDSRHEEMRKFVDDLKKVAVHLQQRRAA
jgi:uracil-DNA glycosylase family protein